MLALLVALLGPFLAPHDAGEIVGAPLVGPRAGTPLGTDYLGHDVLSRVLHGGRSLVLLPLVATLAVSAIGATLGSSPAIWRAASTASSSRRWTSCSRCRGCSSCSCS
jgi:ABC-type dipeptide/oligopeptide/nickel transport system permease subunit